MGLDVTYKFEYSSTVPYRRDQLLFRNRRSPMSNWTMSNWTKMRIS